MRSSCCCKTLRLFKGGQRQKTTWLWNEQAGEVDYIVETSLKEMAKKW